VVTLPAAQGLDVNDLVGQAERHHATIDVLGVFAV
jgi:hypothetical protein